jgi:RHS repeat-associated protein
LPFGDGQSCTGTMPLPLHYTDEPLDTESGLHHFLFRQLSTTQGRWATSDPAGLGAASAADPQTWNRYAYVGNQPLTYLDPLGLCPRTDRNCRKPPINPTCLVLCNPPQYGDPEPIDPFAYWGIPVYEWLDIDEGWNWYNITSGFEWLSSQGFTGIAAIEVNAANNCKTPGFNGCYGPPKPLTKTQCDALRTVLDREAQFGTPQAARMSSNTLGDRTLTPFNSEYVPNLQTPVGELDLDWYTDLQGWGVGFQPVVYPVMKTAWTVTRLLAGHSIGNPLPFQDPGERTAMLESMNGGYKDIFTPSYMGQVCPQ